MNGMILYPTHDDIKVLNEAELRYGYGLYDIRLGKVSNIDFKEVSEILPSLVCCGIIEGIFESLIYPHLKINETVLG